MEVAPGCLQELGLLLACVIDPDSGKFSHFPRFAGARMSFAISCEETHERSGMP